MVVRTSATETTSPARARRDRPAWPPRRGTRCGVYLPGAWVEHRSEVLDMAGTELLITAPAGADRHLVEPGVALKLLFPSRSLPMGVDGMLLEQPRSGEVPWMLEVTGAPIAVERREHERVPCHDLVVIRVNERMIPAHRLDRSANGMRCASGRGVQLAVDDRIDVEVGQAETVHGARVVWQRLGARGLEFGLHF